MQIFVRLRAAGVATFVAGMLVTAAAMADSFSSVATFAGDPTTRVLKEPYGVVVLPSGELLVGDTKNNRIQRISTGGAIAPFAGSGKSGSKDGAAAVAEFKDPMGLAHDRVRSIVYVADSGNDRIRRIAADGTVSTVAVSGLKRPSDVAVDADGNLYVADTGHDVIRKITPAGTMTIIAGISNDHPDGPEGADIADNQYVDGPALQATFDAPAGLALTSGGVLYIVDTKNDAVRKLEGGVVSTVAGGKRSGYADGPALAARFDRPTGIAIDPSGNLLVADRRNERIRKVTLGANAAVSTVAGTGKQGLVNGAPASAQFKSPSGLSFAGVLYVTDTRNDVVRVLHPVVSSPAITSVIPPVARAAGADVRVLGSNFVSGQTAVSFGTTAAAQVTFVSASEVVAKVPALSSAKYDVKVTTPGGSAILPDGFTFDADAPLITAAVAPAPNGAGWNNAAVRVTFTCVDALSGIATCTPPVDVAAEGAAHVVTGVAVDAAGNQQSVTVTVKLDQGLPVITAAVTPAPNAAGWTNGDTTVRFEATDALSGVASVTPLATIATETAAQQVTGRATDVAGNAAETSVTVKLDKTAPTATATAAPTPNAAGWNNSVITVTFDGTDALSGVASIEPPKSVAADGEQTVTGTVTDKAGNSSTASAAVKLDRTAPTITGAATPAANAAGWNNSAVTVDFDATDALSGVAVQPSPVTIAAEGREQIASGTATDAAGNSATAEVTVNVDRTDPVATATAAPAPNAAGWNNSDVTVTFGGTDALSGVATTSAPVAVSTETSGQTVSGTVTDAAGNSATASTTVKLDKTAPAATATAAPAPNAAGWNNSAVTVTFDGTDAMSGVAAIEPPKSVTADGEQTVSGTVTDKAGNVATASAAVKLDRAAPTVTGTATPAPNAAGWNNSAVTVGFTATDALSGVAVQPSPVTIATEGREQVASGTATDAAGNSATAEVTVHVDRTNPTATAAAAPAPNAAGWNNSDVTVTFNGTDALSGVATIDPPKSVTADGEQTVTGRVLDTAGNAAEASVAVRLDKTAPTVTTTIAPAPNAAGWNTADARVTFNCTDAVSGIATCPPAVDVTVEGTAEVSGTAVDVAGNETSLTAAVKIDKTRPTIEFVLPPMDITRYFGRSSSSRDIDIIGNIVDAGSGVVSVTCNGSAAVIEEGQFLCTVTLQPGQTPVSVVATDAAGNTHQVQRELTYILDDTPPTITAVVPPPNAAGWLRNVSVISYLCDDNVALSICPGSEYPNDGANQRFTGTAVDAAGNEASVTITVSIDSQPPLLSVSTPQDSKTNAATFTITGTASDLTSGVHSVRCGSVPATVSGNTFTCVVPLAAGLNAIRVHAADVAGNEQSEEITVTLDSVAPEITITAPEDNATFGEEAVEVTGTVTDDRDVAEVTVNGVPAALEDDRFAAAVPLSDGVNTIEVRATDTYGNTATRSISVRRVVRGSLVITSPADLAVVRSNAVTVTGTFSGPITSIHVNGFDAAISGLTFTAPDVPLVQGRTVLTATATTTGGQIITASLNVYRDSIPPRAIVEYPAAGATVFGSETIVSGTVDDLVVGTINAGQVTLTVNGIPAEVVNRTFKASGVELAPGRNTLIIVAEDQGGNTTTVSHEVHSTQAPAARVEVLSGDDQTAAIGAQLSAPVRVRVVDGAGNPRAGVEATFAVTQNNGSLRAGDETGRRVVAVTNGAGEAEVRWTLGMRAGVGNQRLEIGAPGAEPAHVFASGRTGTPELVVVDMGDNQFGVNGERLPRPLVVAVVDAGSNRLADVPVRFTILGGGGTIDGQSSVELRTDSDGRAWVTPTLGPDSGFDNHLIEASVNGVASTAVFRASSAHAGPVSETKISGVILDNSSIPIAGATVRIEGTNVALQSDAQGQFVIPNAPVGYVRLIIDGSTVQRPGTWPMLEFAMYTNAGQDNTIGMPIFLLPIDVTRGVQVSEQQGGRITLPELPGFSLDIAPGSVTFPGGGRIGTISATLVHSDKMPMVPGFGQQPRFIVTIQPAGAHFDPPAALTMPNVDGFGPGEVTELYSFDHDLGQFVAIGTGSVSEDGTIVRSDPGVGIIKAGWHCGGSPAGTGTTSCVNVSLTIDEAASGGSTATTSATSARTSRLETQSVARPRVGTDAVSIVAEKTTLTDVCVVLRASGSPTTAGSNGHYTWTKSGGEWVGGSPPPCHNQPTCTAKIRSNDPANITVTVTYTASTASGTQSSSKSANIKFIHATFRLEELSFLGDLQIKKDLPGVAATDINDPVWKDTNAPSDNDPVAYVGNFGTSGRKIKVKAKFRIAPAPTVAVKVTFEGKVLPSGGIAGGILKKERTINAGQTEITIDDFDVTGLADLPNTTASANPLTIEWTVKPAGACPDATPFEAGISSNQMYVTLRNPSVSPLYATLLHLATAGNAATDQQALDQTWAQFGTGSAPANVKGWSPVAPSNRQLKYYPEGFSYGSVEQNDFANFLQTGGGRCGMHQQLFRGALAVNGISSISVEVNVDQSGCGSGTASQKCGHAFLVKNWTFGAESLASLNQTEYRYLMRTTCNGTSAECLLELVPPPNPPNRYADLTNETGVPGQNTVTPSQKLFGDHAIVRTTVDGTTRHYDPSYGLTYNDAADFATKSVDGFVLVMTLTPVSSTPPTGSSSPPSPDPRLKQARKRVSNAPGTELGVKFTPP